MPRTTISTVVLKSALSTGSNWPPLAAVVLRLVRGVDANKVAKLISRLLLLRKQTSPFWHLHLHRTTPPKRLFASHKETKVGRFFLLPSKLLTVRKHQKLMKTTPPSSMTRYPPLTQIISMPLNRLPHVKLRTNDVSLQSPRINA
jgi:hypothetical protein